MVSARDVLEQAHQRSVFHRCLNYPSKVRTAVLKGPVKVVVVAVETAVVAVLDMSPMNTGTLLLTVFSLPLLLRMLLKEVTEVTTPDAKALAEVAVLAGDLVEAAVPVVLKTKVVVVALVVEVLELRVLKSFKYLLTLLMSLIMLKNLITLVLVMQLLLVIQPVL